ncbi:zinc finger CCHC domain-containing protein 14 isoform X7 [Siniperca chuatsi]|uniref:zinc finger CCHC domain-containing protein 14 isoform X7 n=1 Tax=Siniperca chuatsi TaxID=119488 RepID=UPI001CE0C4E4|nr:zinc finger CCHC domain-containing protein 14 isoform X7 [Siniperca chuatsi]
MVESRSCVQREGVYRWFSSLTSAQRAEFLCGLLDLCVPIELRFLGSCLEDLARKDYHSLRDAEIKANNPADLSGLTNITDEVVRSKLLVSLALLGSDNREAAGVLYRTLTHIDTVINNYGLALNDGRTEEQFLLLFTMASHHPAFSFHQKQVLRQQLGQIQDILQVSSGGGGEAQAAGPGGDRAAVCYAQPHHHYHHQTLSLPLASLSSSACSLPDASAAYLPLSACQPCQTHCTCWHKFMQEMSDYSKSGVATTRQQDKSQTREAGTVSGPGSGVTVGRRDQAVSQELTPHHPDLHPPLPPPPPIPPPPPPHLPPPLPAGQGQDAATPTKNHQGKAGKNLGCTVQYRGTNRAVYRVASVQPVVSTHSSVLTRPSPHLSSLPPPLPPSIPPPQLSSLPPPVPALPTQSSMAGGGDHSSQAHPQHSQSHSYSQHHLHPQTSSQSSAQSLHLSHSLPMSHSHSQSLSYPQSHSLSRSQSLTQAPSQPSTPEQNGILDWLRKLRLHKYYPVFKQLTMEEFLALTEEDLNKYDLTQGAKKKLKTQLELQKSVDRDLKMEKRSCSGIARVTPSSHMGPSTHPTSTAGELRVEVDAVLHHHPVSTDSSSSSGYSSSSCSPRTPICCDSTFDRTRDIHRRVSGPDAAGGGPEKDRSCLFILNSSCPTGSSRPTAQVLPVQTDPTPPLPPSCSFGLPQSSYHPQASYPQTLLSPVSNPARILTSPRKPRPPPLCMEDRTKPLGSGLPAAGAAFSTGLSVGMGVRLENLFPGLNMDGSSTLQDSVVCRGLAGGAVGLMVETSSALTSTSNSLHHVSHPPLHFHLSSSSSPSPSGYYSYPPTSSSSSCPSTKSGLQSGTSSNVGGFVPKATASSVPVAAVPGNTYYPPQPTSSPSPSPSSASSLDQSSGHNPSMCVCSSCGCRGNCGAYGALPGYAAAGYLQPFSAGPSLFTLGPLLHLSPLIASSSAAGTGATPFSYPMMVPPPLYRHSPASHDQQQGFAFYQPHGIVGNGGQKRAAGNLSCYNCGANGHRAEECKQPAMDSAQQGTFRLKYTPHADSKDSGD